VGLYALAARMKSLGGNCGVAGRLDGQSGSCFWITIPFKPDETLEEGQFINEADKKNPLSVTPAMISHDSDDRNIGDCPLRI
jgi:hypothetical protein